MAANLEVVNGQASMVYHGDVPWHGLGKHFTRRLSVGEALKESGADYQVERWNMGYIEPKTEDLYAAEDVFACVRTDNKEALGFVGKDYVIVQNRDAFNFLSPIIEASEGVIETMGVLGKGERAWALIKLPDHIVVTKRDEIGKYVLVYNGFNGKTKIRAKYTPIRVVCQNTLSMALAGIDTEVGIRHTTNVQSVLAEAHKVMGMANAVSTAITPVYQKMAATSITEAKLKEFIATLVPIAKDAKRTARAEAVRAEIMRLHEVGKGADFSRGTIWGAYNAVTEYVDHVFSGKNDADTRLNTIWWGAGEELKVAAFNEAVMLLKA